MIFNVTSNPNHSMIIMKRMKHYVILPSSVVEENLLSFSPPSLKSL